MYYVHECGVRVNKITVFIFVVWSGLGKLRNVFTDVMVKLCNERMRVVGRRNQCELALNRSRKWAVTITRI